MIRIANNDDYLAVNNLMLQVHEIHVNNRPDFYVHQTNMYTEEAYKAIMADYNSVNLLYEDEGNVVGLCFLTIREKSGDVPVRVAYMESLCVDERCRCKGIGTQLYYAAVKESKKRRVDRLDLMVWGFNENAKRFYLKRGMNVQKCILEIKLEVPT